MAPCGPPSLTNTAPLHRPVMKVALALLHLLSCAVSDPLPVSSPLPVSPSLPVSDASKVFARTHPAAPLRRLQGWLSYGSPYTRAYIPDIITYDFSYFPYAYQDVDSGNRFNAPNANAPLIWNAEAALGYNAYVNRAGLLANPFRFPIFQGQYGKNVAAQNRPGSQSQSRPPNGGSLPPTGGLAPDINRPPSVSGR